jgi:hypothetical protein
MLRGSENAPTPPVIQKSAKASPVVVCLTCQRGVVCRKTRTSYIRAHRGSRPMGSPTANRNILHIAAD